MPQTTQLEHPPFPQQPQLIKEGNRLAEVYKNKSVAEQNSVDLAWDLLMDEGFKELRAVIYTTDEEMNHFRQLLVQLVMATGKQLCWERTKIIWCILAHILPLQIFATKNLEESARSGGRRPLLALYKEGRRTPTVQQ